MKFEEILPFARQKKKIRCVEWSPTEFIVFGGECFFDQDIVTCNIFSAIEILDSEWELIEQRDE